MITKTVRFILLAALCSVALAGCATAPKDKKEAKSDDDQYEWVKPVGSNIAVKVRKGQKAPSIASPTDTMNGDDLSRAVHAAGASKPGSN